VQVTFYGVRGSIATPGPSTVRYGGNTSCVSVRTADGSAIVLDIGTGARLLGDELVARGPLPVPIHVLVTHGHWDHVIGAPFFAPLYRPEAHVILHTLSERMHGILTRFTLFDGDHFPVRARDLPARVERPPAVAELTIGSARVTRIALNHPGGADGFRIDDGDGSSLCYLTDNELAPPGPPTTTPAELARFASGASLVIHDAQYLPADMPEKHGWGHSLVDDVLDLGRDAGARVLALSHHDPSRDDRALDDIAAAATAWAASHAPGMRVVVAHEGLTLDV
jgi:phosphoribosyl 1,2-cyclic phosphodiesterase